MNQSITDGGWDGEREFYERFGANKIWVTPSRENVETVLEIAAFIRTQISEAVEKERERILAALELENATRPITINFIRSLKDTSHTEPAPKELQEQ